MFYIWIANFAKTGFQCRRYKGMEVFVQHTRKREVFYLYNEYTDICFGAICSQECNLTIVSHDEPSSPQNGTIKCRNQLQQCRMSGTSQVSFSVRGSCSSSSDFVRLAVIDNRAGVCGEDRPLCFNGKCFVIFFFSWFLALYIRVKIGKSTT